MSNGKGQTPRKGYNYQKYAENYDQIFRKQTPNMTTKASFSQLSNDLYWSAFINGATCRWTGYNDAYWWNNVATTDQFQVKEHQGKRYRLNPENNEITPL